MPRRWRLSRGLVSHQPGELGGRLSWSLALAYVSVGAWVCGRRLWLFFTWNERGGP